MEPQPQPEKKPEENNPPPGQKYYLDPKYLAEWTYPERPKEDLPEQFMSGHDFYFQDQQNVEDKPFPIHTYKKEEGDPLVIYKQKFDKAEETGILNLGGCHLTVDDIEQIVEKRKLDNLTELNLDKNYIEQFGAVFLLGMQQLKVLRLMNNDIGDVGCRKLATKDFPFLQIVDLRFNEIRQGLIDLAKFNQNIVEFRLAFNDIRNTQVRGMVELAQFPKLKILDLGCNKIKNQGAGALKKYAATIEIFDFRQNQLGDKGLGELLSQKFQVLRVMDLSYNKLESLHSNLTELDQLVHLDLSHNSIDEDGCQRLGNATFRQLKLLKMNGNRIGQGTRYLTKLHTLQRLQMHRNFMFSEGLKALCEGEYMPNLTHLQLQENKIPDEFIPLLSKFKKLEYLGLWNNKITIDAAKQILEFDMPDLKRLQLGYNKLKEDGREEMTQKCKQKGIEFFLEPPPPKRSPEYIEEHIGYMMEQQQFKRRYPK